MKQVVVMPGGFHPFHAGHAALYQSARQAFPNADVYVAATDDTSTRPFPFQVKEKLAQLAGVDKGRFMRVKSPFQATEITAPYNAEDTQLIFVRSQKDADKPPRPGGVKKNGEPSYLQPYSKNSTAPMSQHGYMAYLPTVEFGPGMTSATEIRAAWPKLNEKRKTALVMSLYPKTQTNPRLAATVVKMLDTAIGTEVAENQGWAATYEADGLTAGTGVTGGMHATYQDRYNQPVREQEQLSGSIRAVPKGDSEFDWDYYYKDQLIAPGTDVHSKVKDLHFTQKNPYYQQFKDAFANPAVSGAAIPPNKWPENQPSADRVVPPPLTIPKQFIKDLDGNPVRLKDYVPGDPRISEDYMEEDKVDPITSAAVDFYQNKVGNVSTKPVANYRKIARELLQKTDNPTMREKIMNILVQGNKNPYIQGGVITTVGALLAGGILSSASQAGLSPQQTNILLQAVLNTVIPTMVSRVNGRSWRDTIKYTLASAGIGTGIAAMTETGRKK
jgi:hypothetical protein